MIFVLKKVLSLWQWHPRPCSVSGRTVTIKQVGWLFLKKGSSRETTFKAGIRNLQAKSKWVFSMTVVAYKEKGVCFAFVLSFDLYSKIQLMYPFLCLFWSSSVYCSWISSIFLQFSKLKILLKVLKGIQLLKHSVIAKLTGNFSP